MNARYLILILFGLAFAELFTIIPDSEPMDYFPLYDPPGEDYMITRKTYFYFMGQHLFLMCFMAFVIFIESPYRTLFKNFFLIEVFYFADYILIYHNSYFHIAGIGINYTYVRLSLYTYLILKDIWAHRKYY